MLTPSERLEIEELRQDVEILTTRMRSTFSALGEQGQALTSLIRLTMNDESVARGPEIINALEHMRSALEHMKAVIHASGEQVSE